MKICIYGASSNIIDKSFIDAGEQLGKEIAQNGHSVIFGGGAAGLMGAVARGMRSKGGNIIGVTPTFFKVDGMLFEDCTDMIYTETMRERKKLLEEMSDAFIVTPGGIGTFDEFFEIYTLRQLGVHQKPIAILNTDGYYDSLIDMLKNAIDKNFMPEANMNLLFISDNPKEILNHIENYNPDDYKDSQFKFLKK
ncbi:MAG: TIGR00730 family Rossman fold protein [Acutalibacteraceae bacterium]|nr:TIGR00730 family Rossman fold protein [Acutalibacteraceae bacterium]